MNTKNLKQIFANYIDRFEEMNDTEHDENFKWYAAFHFRRQMDEALQLNGKDFVLSLEKIRDVVKVLIDGRMQPFGGLVAIAKKDNCELADEVKKLFVDLFKDDGDDLEKREEKIAFFLQESEKLRLKKFPKYYSYKQTARSVSGYLFLYDPDNHYMYKAMQAKLFADCIEFYGDWGSGDQIDLKEYYRMCDELVSEIEKCPELLTTDQSRFDGRFRVNPDEMVLDSKHHILAYDIIYCTSVYGLFKGLTFKPITIKDRNLYQERLARAQVLLESYDRANRRLNELKQAEQHYNAILVPGTQVRHSMYGIGTIVENNSAKIIVSFENGDEPKIFDYYFSIADGHLKFADSLDEKTEERYRTLCKHHTAVYEAVGQLQKELEEYRDIIE